MSYLSNILISNKERSLLAIVPDTQLLDKSVHMIAPRKSFSNWSAFDHAESYLFMQRIVQVWKNSHFTDQYLIYGKIGSSPFHWEMVPYQKCSTWIGRVIQQLQVLWRIVFGGIQISEEGKKNQVRRYESLLNFPSKGIEVLNSSNKKNDSFCKDDVIERQWVITGKKVNVLFNYAPIGFGGERLHFLVVPKEHRETFEEVTQEEYCESLKLTKKLVVHFAETRKNIKNVYLFNKTGVDVGQTVNHWHLHVIFLTNTTQDFWGKLTVVKNILLGSSPMKKDDLAKKVNILRKELAKEISAA